MCSFLQLHPDNPKGPESCVKGRFPFSVNYPRLLTRRRNYELLRAMNEMNPSVIYPSCEIPNPSTCPYLERNEIRILVAKRVPRRRFRRIALYTVWDRWSKVKIWKSDARFACWQQQQQVERRPSWWILPGVCRRSTNNISGGQAIYQSLLPLISQFCNFNSTVFEEQKKHVCSPGHGPLQR